MKKELLTVASMTSAALLAACGGHKEPEQPTFEYTIGSDAKVDCRIEEDLSAVTSPVGEARTFSELRVRLQQEDWKHYKENAPLAISVPYHAVLLLEANGSIRQALEVNGASGTQSSSDYGQYKIKATGVHNGNYTISDVSQSWDATTHQQVPTEVMYLFRELRRMQSDAERVCSANANVRSLDGITTKTIKYSDMPDVDGKLQNFVTQHTDQDVARDLSNTALMSSSPSEPVLLTKKAPTNGPSQ